MNRKYEIRQWDATDDWACQTFGIKTPKNPPRKVMLRNALHKTVGQAAFDALFRAAPTAMAY